MGQILGLGALGQTMPVTYYPEKRLNMSQAIWRGAVIVDGDDVALVEENADFPIASVKMDHLHKSATTVPTYCHWEGIAYYYHISVDGDVNAGAAWTYGTPYTA